MPGIESFFLRSLMTSPEFLSPEPVDDVNLLFPAFYEKVKQSIVLYKKSYPLQNIVLAETYRSNVLQEVYFNRGASKIKKDGMHHYGIACDCMFIIDGKRSYKGDIELLRQIHEFNGLTILGMWDPLHVQFIQVAEQIQLRADVSNAIISFQRQFGLPVTGEPDLATRNKAIELYGFSTSLLM